MREIAKISIILLTILWVGGSAYSQKQVKSQLSTEEENLYRVAYRAFDSEDFVPAHAMFSQLLSLHNQEPAFKYYFAVCMIELRQEFERAIDYLRDAAANNFHIAYFHIGRAYHKLYDFDNAIANFNRFMEAASNRELRNLDVERHIRIANNGRDLVRFAYELRVVNNIVLGENNFHYSYDFSDFGGRIIVKPENFRTRADRNIEGLDLMYISDLHDIIFMSSYGTTRRGSLNIYQIKREEGEWGSPEILPAPINDEYDQAFPFIAADGKTLFFSSKGHNTMGGYDIFKSVYDSAKNIWSEPENLDFPINTPYDDIMFVQDIHNETAFFASNRTTGRDRIAVFRILLETDPEMREVLTVKDAQTVSNLEVSSDAVEELTLRERKREKEIKEEEDIVFDTITDIIAEKNIADSLIEFTNNLIDSLRYQNTASNEIVNKAHIISENSIRELSLIREKINSLEQTDNNQKIINELNKQLAETSRVASTMYSIARDGARTISSNNTQIDFYKNELKNLESNIDNVRNVEDRFNEIISGLKRINVTNPDQRIAEQKEIEVADLFDKVSSHDSIIYNIAAKQKTLKKDIDNLKNAAIRSETNTEREEIINEIAKKETELRNLSANLTRNKIEKAILAGEIEIKNQEISFAENIDNFQIPKDQPEADIADIQRDIEVINVFLNQEDLRTIAQKQNRIQEETRFETVLDDIIAEINKRPLPQPEIKDVRSKLVDYSSKIKSEKEEFLSTELIEFIDLLSKSEDYKAQISSLEHQYSSASENERENISAQISVLEDSLINNKSHIQNLITERPVSETPENVKELFAEIRDDVQKHEDLTQIASNTESLISELDNISSLINELTESQIEETDEDILIYLDNIKAEIKLSVSDNLTAMLDFVEKREHLLSEDFYAELTEKIDKKTTISHYQESVADSLQNQLIANIEKINELIYITEAGDEEEIELRDSLNRLQSIAKDNHLMLLNEKIGLGTGKLEVYEDFYSDYEQVLPETARIFKSDIAELRDSALSLIHLSEAEPGDSNKAELLTKAHDKIELAVLYYEHITDLVRERTEPMTTEQLAALHQTQREPVIDIGISYQDIPPEIIHEDPVDVFIEVSDPEIIAISNKVNELNEYAIQIESDLNRLLEQIEDLEDEEPVGLSKTLDSLSRKLNNTIEELGREYLIAQQREISTNNALIESEQLDENYSELFEEYNQSVQNALQADNFLILDEVIITGQSILEMQNQKISRDINLPEYNRQLSLLYETHLTAQKITEQIHDDLASADTYDEVIDASDLTELSEVTADFSQTQTEIESIQNRIQTTESRRERERLQEELEQLKANQINNLVQINAIRGTFISSVYETSISKAVDTDTLVELQNYYDELSFLRNTMINYNSFYDFEYLLELNNRIYAKEIQLLDLVDELYDEEITEDYIASSPTDILEDKLPETEHFEIISDAQPDDFQQKDLVTQDDIYNFLPDISTKEREELEISLIENKNIITSLENEIQETRSRLRKRRISREKEKEEEVLMQKAKNLAAEELNILRKKESAISDYFDIDKYDEIEIIGHISDSLSNAISENISKSKSIYEKILDGHYDAWQITQQLESAKFHTYIALTDYSHKINLTSFSTTYAEWFDDYIERIAFEKETLAISEEDSLLEDDVISELAEEEYAEEDIDDSDTMYADVPTDEDYYYFFDEILILPDSGESVYSDENPIEEIEEIPMGLNYRIQIGAFNRPVPNDSFTGISPILIENIQGSRLLRYVVGLFSTYQNASAALPEVRGLGFSDCFVVAYYNGERIPLYRAREIEQQAALHEIIFADILEIEDAPETIEEADEPHINVRSTDNAFFTVQIGVYRTLIAPVNLYGLSPINYDRMDNGLIRHLYGKFYDYNTAVNVQNRIREIGISDAFVTAYYNGQRISVTEAREIIPLQETTTDLPRTDRIEAEIETTEPDEHITPVQETQGPEYFVQLGAYRTSIGEDLRISFSEIAPNKTLIEVTDESNLIIYRLGNISSHRIATEVRDNAVRSGISDAFIIATINGERVPVSVAIESE